MGLDRIALQWIFLALACGIALHVYDSHSLIRPATIQDVYAHSPPFRVEFSGEVNHFRVSSGAWVFDLVNEGTITCYYRHPPSFSSAFNHEQVTVRGRIDPTPRGILCIVEELIFHAPAS